MSRGIRMKTDGTELSALDLYGWIKEEACPCDMLTVVSDRWGRIIKTHSHSARRGQRDSQNPPSPSLSDEEREGAWTAGGAGPDASFTSCAQLHEGSEDAVTEADGAQAFT